ncbi:indolepyruvate ferredoxin oxidoreductase family protein [Zhongshania aquimaris]|uniref:Indolepyruvate ferredoxin oxidoreductase family protein n=1 Tax=Zhongshania aquimaris TaxID=2857107 RepID=A0ABS6VNM6_9GAMM|nr:indolepyruvate ferredoxin oxidoreductase family protein [Zhongshania aquimaris]
MSDFSLSDKYTATSGRIYVTGSQALTRLPIMQNQRDAKQGLNTAGFISGYRGSPLGVYDLALWQAEKYLKEHQIHFQPGVNEDLAATAVWGSQQVSSIGESLYDGVFSMWYGKGPGVDRSGDPLKHGNWAGASKHGGVLVLCGDDHSARSSTTAHQSEHALIHFGMPILNPASVQEYLDYGLYGFALSRYCGAWIGFKCVTDTVEASASVSIDPERVCIAEPKDYPLPAGGLNLQQGLIPIQSESLMLERLEAAKAFVRANKLDITKFGGGSKKLGIVTTGKAYLDLMDALSQLGINETEAEQLGIAVYKVAMVWPLEPEGLKEFASNCETLMVIEEKRPIIEEQIAALLINLSDSLRPKVIGKFDLHGKPLLPSNGELSPGIIAQKLTGEILARCENTQQLKQNLFDLETNLATQKQLPANQGVLARLPSFCAGCPHNTSTKVPEGSVAHGGIGCHGLAVWLPGRNTVGLTHMGGEGATWIGQAPFMKRNHVFQNMGDGTYFHSGLLAIRANVAAKTNITYKILVNGAISMTGGQPIEGESFNGEITAPHVAQQIYAEGVQRIALVTDDLLRHHDRSQFPSITSFHHRDELDQLQRQIRDVKGTSAIIYEQACATERRRLRKRGEYPDVDKRTFINQDVCEGCGDCGVQSNCIAIEPVETRFGRKRKINQSVCNKDFSCVKGMCPSFVTVTGGKLRASTNAAGDIDPTLFATLSEPVSKLSGGDCNILVAGIGGSGIITLGALLGVAAHMEGKACSVLDLTGLAQRNGPVTSHIRLAIEGQLELSTRIPEGAADLVLAADLVVASSGQVLPTLSQNRSSVVYNSYIAPTNAFASNADLSFDSSKMEVALQTRTRNGQAWGIDATGIASKLLGNAIGANSFLLGIAYQQGLIPLKQESLEKAIRLNGAEIEMNLHAFRLGRLSVVSPEKLEDLLTPSQVVRLVQADTLEQFVAERVEWLSDYQDPTYAQQYKALVDKVVATEIDVTGTHGPLSKAVARYYSKLLAYKDEYEVARLYTRPEFMARVRDQFDGDFKLSINLAPPLLSRRDPNTGRYAKKEFGAWILSAFKLLARLKVLRGTPLDIFGYSTHRRQERQLISEYKTMLEDLLPTLTKDNHALAVKLACLPERIRGYDVVKEEHLHRAEVEKMRLLAEYQDGGKQVIEKAKVSP